MEAALSPGNTFHDFSKNEELWIDYVSDLGDGFNSTYTVAHLLAQPEVDVNGDKLKRGNILVMGGDAVYPTRRLTNIRTACKVLTMLPFPGLINKRRRDYLSFLETMTGMTGSLIF